MMSCFYHFQLEELTLPVAIHMQRVVKTNFAVAWEEYGEEGEAEETYFLTKFSTLDGTLSLNEPIIYRLMVGINW